MSDTPFTDKHTLKGYPSGEFVPASECRKLEDMANMLATELYVLSRFIEGANEVYRGRLHIDTDMADAAYCKYRCRV
jgi:hypothetical protein